MPVPPMVKAEATEGVAKLMALETVRVVLSVWTVVPFAMVSVPRPSGPKVSATGAATVLAVEGPLCYR